jgi:hypothetical protein
MNKALILLSLVINSQALAQEGVVETSADVYPTELVRTDVLKKQDTYAFTVKKYDPPVIVQRLADAKAPAVSDSPEAVAKSHFAAMAKGDYPLWLSLWDVQSKKNILRENSKLGRDGEFWERLWLKSLGAFDTFYLSRRVDSGYYTIVELTAVDSTGERTPLHIEVPLLAYNTKHGMRYAVTDKMDDDPVFKHWRKENPVLSRVVR